MTSGEDEDEDEDETEDDSSDNSTASEDMLFATFSSCASCIRKCEKT